MGIASLIIGILSLAGLFLAFLPGLGFLHWMTVALAVAGLFLGLAALARRKKEAAALIGTIWCGLAATAGAVILGIGRGVI